MFAGSQEMKWVQKFLAYLCIPQVVRSFDDLVASDLSNGMKVGESEIYNTAQQSAEIRWFRRMAFGSQNFSTDFYNTQSSGQSSGENNSGKQGEV